MKNEEVADLNTRPVPELEMAINRWLAARKHAKAVLSDDTQHAYNAAYYALGEAWAHRYPEAADTPGAFEEYLRGVCAPGAPGLAFETWERSTLRLPTTRLAPARPRRTRPRRASAPCQQQNLITHLFASRYKCMGILASCYNRRSQKREQAQPASCAFRFSLAGVGGPVSPLFRGSCP